jgi:serine/threonine protein kinase
MPYAAPEFVTDKLPISEKSDGWSIGMLLYELYEGRLSVHYLKNLNGDVLKNLSKFNPILYNRQGGGGVLLITRKLREIVGKLLSVNPK